MKRCPECRRDYYDDSLLYCLDDGTALLEGPSLGTEPATALFPSTPPSNEALTRPIGSTPSFNNAESPHTSRELPPRSKVRNRLWVFLLIGLVAAGAGAFAIYKSWSKPEPTASAIQIDRLTTNGRSTSAAISPDGKYVIYGVDEGGQDSLWLRQVATTSNVEIFPASEDVFYWGLTFTPDSDYINFIRAEFEKNIGWSLSQMPVLGGAQKKLMTGIEGGVSYSPDRTQFTFIRDEYPTAGESSLLIANADGSGERLIASRRDPETFPARRTAPAWSPDGKTIACIISDETTLIPRMEVVEINVADGSVRPIVTQEWKFISQIAWLRDKSSLLVLGSDKASSSYVNQIWLFSYPDGKARRVTTDFNDYRSVSLNSDSSILVTVQSNSISNIWAAPNGDASRAVQIRSGGNNLDGLGLSAAPDGRIVFYSRAGGGDDIWIMNPDGSAPQQLTTGGGASFQPSVSPDGRYIIFASERGGQVNIWRMGLDGSAPTQLTTANSDHSPAVSPDSRWVVYTSEVSGEPYLWKVSVDGGQPTRIADGFAQLPQVSPDGKWIVCSYRQDENTTWRYAVIPFDGGEPVKVFDLIGKKENFRWSADNKSLYYLRDTKGGVTNIWRFPLQGGDPKPVTDFKTENIFDFVWSTDGKQLILARGTNTSDVVLIRNF